MPQQLLNRWGSWVVPDLSLPLEKQIFQGLCLVAGLMSLFVVLPINSLQNLPAWENLVVLLFGLELLALAWAARRGHYFVLATFISAVASLDLLWFPNAGSQGSIGLYFFGVTFFLVVFSKKTIRRAGFILLVANIVGLHLAENAWPQLVHPFRTPAERLLDLSTGYLLSLLLCAGMLGTILSRLNRERNRLAESERFYRELLERQGEGFGMVDAEERFILANPVAEMIFGVPPGGLVGRSLLEFLGEAQQRQVQAETEERKNGRPNTYELDIRRPGGELRTILVTATPRPDETGRALQVIAVFRDITERKEAEARLRASEERYRVQFDRASEGILTFSPDGEILEVNEAMARMHGYSIEEMRRLRLKDLDTPEIFQLAPGRLARLMAGEALIFELEHTHKDGHSFPLEVSASLVSPGDRPAILTFNRDITERKRAEEMARLLEQEKQQTQKMDSLGSLAGGVAHDFNNMLGGIMGYADLLLAGEQDPHRQKYLRAILNAASRSSELTQKLLAFGRRGKNRAESLDLPTMVEECLALLRPTMSPDLQVTIDLAGCPPVDGDPSQIHQVLVNLCLNAIEAMPERGTLTIGARSRELSGGALSGQALEPGAYVELEVSDTGVGMSVETQQRIFEPFFTTKTSSSLAGTGLGLSTAYGIVQAHRGGISVSSVLGKGTTFSVYLPVGVLSPRASASAVEPAPGQGVILLVEDEPLLREVGASILQTLGYEVLTAGDGVQGIQVYRENAQRLRAVLLDLKMPNMGGREAFLEFRKINPAIPVIICTGYGDNEEVQDLLTLGATAMLAKPYKIAELASKLGQAPTG